MDDGHAGCCKGDSRVGGVKVREGDTGEVNDGLS